MSSERCSAVIFYVTGEGKRAHAQCDREEGHPKAHHTHEGALDWPKHLRSVMRIWIPSDGRAAGRTFYARLEEP
jgi:hypothetical protein